MTSNYFNSAGTYLDREKGPDNMNSGFFLRGGRSPLLWQFNDGSGDALKFTDVLSSFANNASHLNKKLILLKKKEKVNFKKTIFPNQIKKKFFNL